MSTLKKTLKSIYKGLRYYIVDYGRYKRFVKESHFQIRNAEETVQYILKNQVSVSRYGDGEYKIMLGKRSSNQNPDGKLRERLKEILRSNLPNHIVCIPHPFVSLKGMTIFSKNYWSRFCASNKDFIISITDSNKIYYDTNFTRFYIDFRDKSNVGNVVAQLKRIWDGRDVFIIEGKYSRLGVGNDLFDNAKSIKRILCPSKEAFTKYDEILETATRTIPKDCLVLSALGMTATVLCYDLAKLGYQAIDVGHIDIEYSWFKMGAKTKCPVPGKIVVEVRYMPDEECSDKKYNQSIVATIS